MLFFYQNILPIKYIVLILYQENKTTPTQRVLRNLNTLNMETLKINTANGQEMTKEVPAIVIMGVFNEVARGWIEKQSGIKFKIKGNTMEGKPTSFAQIVAMMMTYNFVTCYVDNWNASNTLYLKPAQVELRDLTQYIFTKRDGNDFIICNK